MPYGLRCKHTKQQSCLVFVAQQAELAVYALLGRLVEALSKDYLFAVPHASQSCELGDGDTVECAAEEKLLSTSLSRLACMKEGKISVLNPVMSSVNTRAVFDKLADLRAAHGHSICSVRNINPGLAASGPSSRCASGSRCTPSGHRCTRISQHPGLAACGPGRDQVEKVFLSGLKLSRGGLGASRSKAPRLWPQ